MKFLKLNFGVISILFLVNACSGDDVRAKQATGSQKGDTSSPSTASTSTKVTNKQTNTANTSQEKVETTTPQGMSKGRVSDQEIEAFRTALLSEWEGKRILIEKHGIFKTPGRTCIAFSHLGPCSSVSKTTDKVSTHAKCKLFVFRTKNDAHFSVDIGYVEPQGTEYAYSGPLFDVKSSTISFDEPDPSYLDTIIKIGDESTCSLD